MKELFDDVSFKCSTIVTQNYSTSFSMGIKLFNKRIRIPNGTKIRTLASIYIGNKFKLA